MRNVHTTGVEALRIDPSLVSVPIVGSQDGARRMLPSCLFHPNTLMQAFCKAMNVQLIENVHCLLMDLWAERNSRVFMCAYQRLTERWLLACRATFDATLQFDADLRRLVRKVRVRRPQLMVANFVPFFIGGLG